MKMASRIALQPFINSFKHSNYRSYLLSSFQCFSTTSTPSMNIVGGDGKGRIVVLGTGWAGFNLVRNLKSDDEGSPEVRVVSPSNHFVFTPLLPSTAVGTLEFRCIQEPIRRVLGKNGKFVQAKASKLDPDTKTLVCISTHDQEEFAVKYDKLVIAVGVKTNTFGIDSITEGDGIYFLKHLYHARNIRNHIIDSFEKAAIPGTSKEERERLLSFVVVGGGPTSCEFVAELHDFVTNDVKRLYNDLVPYVQVTLVEAGSSLLGPFDKKLQQYTLQTFKNRNINIKLESAVTAIEDYDGTFSSNNNGDDGDNRGQKPAKFRFKARRAILSDGSSIPFGTLVWSAGLKPVKFTDALDNILPKANNGRILVDDYLRVKGYEGSIWAMGDSAMNETNPLPQLAQVARQQGIYLSKVFNGTQKEDSLPFEFFNLGSMASLGGFTGLYDGSKVGKTGKEVDISGFSGLMAFLMWRSAYLVRQTSIENQFLILMHWFKQLVFGRDVSRF